jgi:hypothetical protein
MVYLRLSARLPAILAHRIATHLDAVRVVNQPVEDDRAATATPPDGIARICTPTLRPKATFGYLRLKLRQAAASQKFGCIMNSTY